MVVIATGATGDGPCGLWTMRLTVVIMTACDDSGCDYTQ